MKIVIAGGTGMLGQALTRDLVDAGHAVTVLTRRETRGGPGIAYVRWDGKRQGSWVRELEGAGAVLNFTGTSLADRRWTDRQKQRILESRVAPTRALVEAMKRMDVPPPVLISASGVNYYGPRDHMVTEEADPGDDFLAWICSRWEEEARPAEALGVRVVLFRMAVVLTTEGGALPKLLTPFRLFAGSILGPGGQWFPWVHIADILSAVRFTIGHDAVSGPLNVAAPGAVTMAEFCRTLGSVLKRPVLFKLPTPALRLLLGEMADTLLHGQHPAPAKLQRFGYTFCYPRLRPALESILSGRKA